MTRRNYLVAGLCFLLFQIYGQESLTFKEAVSIGLKNNVTLKQQENLLISSNIAKQSSLLALGPTVSINGEAARTDGNSFNQQEGTVVNGVADAVGAQISASMPLFRGLSTLNNYRQSVSQNDAQVQFVKRTKQDVIRNVANQFLTCLLDQRLVSIRERSLEYQKKQFEQIKEQVSAGSRAEADLLNQEFQVKNAELLLLRAKTTLRNDKTTLAQTLMIDPYSEFTLVDPSWDINILSSEQLNVELLYETAKSQRADYIRTKANERASELNYTSSKGSYFPNVSLFANYGSFYNYIHDRPNRTFEQQFTQDNTRLRYGVTFSIPIYGGFTNRAQVVQNKMLYQNAQLESENIEMTIKNDVLRAMQNYQDAILSYESAESQLRASEISYNLENERYTLGVSDIVALTLSLQNYTQAQADFESAKYTLMFQRLLLNYATGTLKFEDIP